jgi:hypothetical protein
MDTIHSFLIVCTIIQTNFGSMRIFGRLGGVPGQVFETGVYSNTNLLTDTRSTTNAPCNDLPEQLQNIAVALYL